MVSTVYNALKFVIDEQKLTQEVLRIYGDAIAGKGIFYGGVDAWRKRFLPQWRIPAELEYSPTRTETRNPELAAKFLWTSVQLERQVNSAYLERKFHEIWNSPQHRWFFFADQARQRSVEDIDWVLDNILHYRIRARPEKLLAQSFKDNSQRLYEGYGGDPRKLIGGLTVEESRQRHMEFEGVGTGIANLNILHFNDRRLAQPTDAENLLFKIDIHKARMPLNVGAITLEEGASRIHMSAIVPKLEQAYKNICLKNELDPSIADAAIWILGSSGCTRADDSWCHRIRCPLLETCLANTPLHENSGAYVILDDKGRRVDKNKNGGYIPESTLPGFAEGDSYVAKLFDNIQVERDKVAKRPHRRWRQERLEDPGQQTLI